MIESRKIRKDSKKTILISAFSAFGGDGINPTELILDKLPKSVNGVNIEKILLPVEFIKAPLELIDLYNKVSPSYVIMLGQAGGRSKVTIEEKAKNVMNARIADNSGNMPVGEAIIDGGESFLYSNLPIDEIISEINNKGLELEKSSDAGEYVCNTVLYRMLNEAKDKAKVGFIHVPFIKEQNHNDKPFMELDDIYDVIYNIIEIITKKEE